MKKICYAFLCLLLFSQCTDTSQNTAMQDYYVFVGTYTQGESEGIYVYRLDIETGALTHVSTASGITNPSFLTLSPDKKYLYSVSETTKFDGQPGGSVSAFSLDAANGSLTFLNAAPTMGGAPCYVSMDKNGEWLFTANYVGGNVAVYPIADDGSIGEHTDLVQHEGETGPNQQRQNSAHAHSVMLSPEEDYAFAADLGLDKLMSYQFDAENGTLSPNEPPFAQMSPGAGPRHFVFHPSGKFVFIINELNASIGSYTYNPSEGTLEHIVTVPTLPEGFEGKNSCADIHISPNGRFVYGSNRGHNSIVVYELDESNGQLTFVEHESTQGETPRNFGIEPTGKFLVVANQKTNNLVVLGIDSDSGKLSPVGMSAEVPAPVCVKFMPIP